MQFFSVTTHLYYLTDQLHVLATVSSHDQDVPKNIKKKNINRWNIGRSSWTLQMCYVKYLQYT